MKLHTSERDLLETQAEHTWHRAELLTALMSSSGAGEEALLLDALCICAGPLVTLRHMLQPERLATCGLLPTDALSQWPAAPYRCQLLVHMVS